MLLGRLRIRGKLILLVAIPLLALLGLIVPVVSNLASTANRASDTAAAATVTDELGVLVEDLQQERLLSIGYLLGVVDGSALTRQSAEVTDQVIDVRQNLGDGLPAEVRAALDAVQQKLGPLRQQVHAGGTTPDEVLDTFVPVLDGMIDSLGLAERADATASTGRELLTLDALLRMNESLTESTAVLAMMARGDAGELALRYHEELTERESYENRFATFATPVQKQLYDLVSKAFQQRLGASFEDDFDADPVATMAARPLAELFPSLQSFSVLGGFVEKRLIDDLSTAVSREQRQALAVAYGIGVGAALLLSVVLLLVAAVARAVARPLIELTRSAERVAEAGEEELRRVADDESETSAPVWLDVLQVSGNDEIGELARAFDRVQNTAGQLVERQVLSRRNVAEMFGHIGRRTQNLVGRQVSLIDQLETQETDGPRLEQLYRLDHLSNRLRRTADSLVVISGSDRGEDHLAPVRLVDVARLALAEIEEYTRVDVDVPFDLMAAPAVVSDLVLVTGELLENATNFSPPHTRVSITARAVLGGVRVVVIDRGIGMSDERLAEENARFTRRERLDLVPTRVLGLFVVGRLTRRHSLGVALSHTPGGGVTATVDIDDVHVAGGRGAVVLSGFDRDWHLPADPEVPGVAEQEAMLTAVSAYDLAPRRTVAARHSTTYRSTVGAAQATDETAPYGAGPARPAGEPMYDWRPWNAFKVGARSLPVGPAPEPSPSTFDPAGPTVPSGAPPPVNGYPPPARTSASGLRQRVPGRQLPVGAAPVVSAAPPAPAEALAARDLVEAFEDGVRRAEEIAGVQSGSAGPSAAAPPAWPPMAQSAAGAHPAAPAASPPVSAPPGGPRPLRRRAPGATLTGLDAQPRVPSPARPAAGQDPGAVRSLVEQFESGVARAQRDASAGTDTEEGTSG